MKKRYFRSKTLSLEPYKSASIYHTPHGLTNTHKYTLNTDVLQLYKTYTPNTNVSQVHANTHPTQYTVVSI